MNDLIDLVARHAAITPAQAGIAVRTILRVLGARLPSPVMGQVSAFLEPSRDPSHDRMRERAPTGALLDAASAVDPSR